MEKVPLGTGGGYHAYIGQSTRKSSGKVAAYHPKLDMAGLAMFLLSSPSWLPMSILPGHRSAQARMQAIPDDLNRAFASYAGEIRRGGVIWEGPEPDASFTPDEVCVCVCMCVCREREMDLV